MSDTPSALDLIKGRPSVSLAEMLATVTADRTPAYAPPAPVLPNPRPLTEAQRKALEDLPSVYGTVSLAEARMLTSTEVRALLDERQTFDVIEKLIKTRREEIKATVYTHLDVALENTTPDDQLPERDVNGWYVAKGRVGCGDNGAKEFSREVSSSAPSVSVAAIKALADDPECDWVTPNDYLACTRSERVLDEAKVLDLLRRRPEFTVRLLSEVAMPGSKHTALYLR
jgi:hypothetical protein